MNIIWKNNREYIILLAIAGVLASFMSIAPFFQGPFLALLNIIPYIAWHNVFELSCIIIAVCIFSVTYYSFELNRNFRNLFLGNIMLIMGFIDFFHMMSFKGMPDFLIPYTTSNNATTFWIIARLVGGAGLLIASIVPADFKLPFPKIFFVIFPAVFSLLVLYTVTYQPDLLPAMYVEGTGLTSIKIVLEISVIAAYLFAILFLLRDHGKKGGRAYIYLTGALMIGIFSEMSFTIYTDVYGIYNFLGHLLKFIMYYLIFRIVFIQSVKMPYMALSRAKDEIKNYADNLDRLVEQQTNEVKEINRKLLEDLEYARDIQNALLPKKLPEAARAAFEAFYFPAERVGGDFYNIFQLDENRIGMYLGDVSGHGVSAAMLTVFVTKSIQIKAENAQGIKEALPPADVMANLFAEFNQSDFRNDVYIVMLYGIFDLSKREFVFSSAGLNVAPMIVDHSGVVSELVIKGFPICKLPKTTNVSYYNSTVRLHKGEKVIFYTDGLVDAENQKKKTYSEDRLKAQLHKGRSMNAAHLGKSIADHVFQFTGKKKLLDDITFFIMEVK